MGYEREAPKKMRARDGMVGGNVTTMSERAQGRGDCFGFGRLIL
jgi:hypothetical protein